MSPERGVRIGGRHVAHPLPQGVDLRPLPGRRQALGGPERVVDHGVLLHGLPQAMGHLHRLEERPAPLAEHVGDHPGLGRLGGRVAGPLAVPGPPLRLAPDHHGHLGGSGEHGGQGVVDEALLWDAELDQVRDRTRCPDPGGHDACGIGIGPAALGDRHPVHRRGEPAAAGIGQCDPRGLRHELHRLGIGCGGAHADQHRRPRIEHPAHRPVLRGPRPPARPGADEVRRSRSIRPRSRQDTSTAPWATASARARSGRS